MASLISRAVVEAIPKDVTTKEALSGIFGSISLATWIFLLVPQLWLNYKTRSADGISLAFLGVWMLGDIANLSGAVWAGLVPTVIALAIYFCFADVILISQCLYYNHINSKINARQALNPPAESDEPSDPTQPLLKRRRSSLGLPGSQRRRSSAPSSSSRNEEVMSQILEEDVTVKAWKKNTISIFLVCVAGAAGWAIAWRSGVWVPTPEESQIPDVDTSSDNAVGAQILGYFSAICYLGARIPQIVKNYREKSCDGLALLFFILSLMGNLTYGLGILFHSLEREYVLTNLPWLIGSLGTMVEDSIIFVQFRIYKPRTNAVV